VKGISGLGRCGVWSIAKSASPLNSAISNSPFAFSNSLIVRAIRPAFQEYTLALDPIAKKRALGAVYTPQSLADWAAMWVLRYASSGRTKLRPLILDPACGDGALLRAVARQDTKSRLFGTDIDPVALRHARKIMATRTRLATLDALIPSKNFPVRKSWEKALKQKFADAVIANPPWGGLVAHERNTLHSAGYELANGQFDSFDLFVELACRITREGGICAFILPDAIFLPEHKSLREMLLTRTSLLLIARVGEGFFKNVYRGCVVLVFRNERPVSTNKVACLRLPNVWRSAILSGEKTFAEAELALSHSVLQSRFANDPHKRFDIDFSAKEVGAVVKYERYINGWTEWLESGRGVELSKSGNIVSCPRCNTASPYPRTEKTKTCAHCGSEIDLEAARQKIILPLQRKQGWSPLIVGEDVGRYFAKPSKCIQLGVNGINYKSADFFQNQKILIRKTGIGLHAALDESGALTNQVVFIYRLKASRRPPAFLLPYFLGVLSSRVMLAYHLKKSGDNEWRSHPYVTQQIIGELPVPNVKEGSWQWAQAKAISSAVRDYIRHPSADADLRIDNLIAGLFDFTSTQCQWVGDVLEKAQSLKAIRTMRFQRPGVLTPIRV
jgi:adenine-specific DNA-methyltransferase